MVGGRDRARLGGVVDLLPQDVDRRALPGRVQLGDDASGVRQRLAGDVRGRDATDDALRHRGQGAGDRAVEETHGAGS